jgi:hypothetical protein
MPVLINEVIIRAVVDNSSVASAASTPGIVTSPATPDNEIAALVLDIIKEKNER